VCVTVAASQFAMPCLFIVSCSTYFLCSAIDLIFYNFLIVAGMTPVKTFHVNVAKELYLIKSNADTQIILRI